MMELDEAIKRAEEVANECTVYFQTSEEVFIRIPSECAEEHRQLAEWLKELKALRKKLGLHGDCRDRLKEVFREYSEIGGDLFHLSQIERIIDGEDWI